METKDIAQKIAAAANDKKAKDILLLNMEGLSPVTDFYVICSAGNSTLVKAIADNIEDKLAEAILNGEVKPGEQIEAGVSGKEIKFYLKNAN
jgi:ribosome-associated protein